MIENTAFVFPGQGSQFVGMGKGFYTNHTSKSRELIEESDKILDYSISQIMFTGPENVLNDTVNTQPALFIHSLAAFTLLTEKIGNSLPAYMAGHSLGQLSAIVAARGMGFDTGLRLVRKRGELMKKAGKINPGRMAAILGLDVKILEKVCEEASKNEENVQVANSNCPGQVVISGNQFAVERAILAARAVGAKRALPLAVSIAAHSTLMNSIQAEWNEAVNNAKIQKPEIPIIGNVSAGPLITAEDLRRELILQMQSRVMWTETIKFLESKQIQVIIEIGPGSVLSGLVKRISGNIETRTFGDPGDYDKWS